jgi:hypothetical protein
MGDATTSAAVVDAAGTAPGRRSAARNATIAPIVPVKRRLMQLVSAGRLRTSLSARPVLEA